jgi:hypothetical protein
MFRLIFWALLIYLAYRVLRALFLHNRDSSATPVQGEHQNQPLDLSKMDVEDAKFQEVKKK